MDTQSPFTDHAAPILSGDPILSDENRADLWDTFNQSKDPAELTQKLMPLAHVPDDTKHQLIIAKTRSMPAADPSDKVITAVNKMKAMAPADLELAEAHPTMLKTLVAAQAVPEQSASDPGSSDKKKQATAALPPRVDGLQHLPPVADTHYRVRASDGGIHDLPKENISKAFEIDPKLQVLNP